MPVMRKLFLDDTRPAPDRSWDVVRSYDAFVHYIKQHGVPDLISFDHDLHWTHCYPESGEFAAQEIPYERYAVKTGYDCAKWLVENGYKLKGWRVHSSNVVGAANISRLLCENSATGKGGTVAFRGGNAATPEDSD